MSTETKDKWHSEWRKIVDAVIEPPKHPICRDCADGDGTCDMDGNLPCDPTDRVIEVFRQLKKELEECKQAYSQQLERNTAIAKDLEYWAQRSADLLKELEAARKQ